jgi:hypothetical protein
MRMLDMLYYLEGRGHHPCDINGVIFDFFLPFRLISFFQCHVKVSLRVEWSRMASEGHPRDSSAQTE